MTGGRSGVKLAADANVLLSAIVGGRAKGVLEHPSVEEALTPGPVLDEVQEYLPELAAKYRLSRELLLTTLIALPLTVVERADYASALPEAARRMRDRDPDDVDLLALALDREVAVWSNDSDFKGTGVKWYTTARLMKRLGMKDKKSR
jgi:predicted nucleic acid-binding protein